MGTINHTYHGGTETRRKSPGFPVVWLSLFPFLMRAALRIQARIRNDQALDRAVADDMGFDDLVHICLCDSAVPDCVGIYHDVGPVFALVETAGLIRAYSPFDASLRQLNFECALKVGFAGRIAATARIRHWPLVATDEDMFLELWHGPKQ